MASDLPKPDPGPADTLRGALISRTVWLAMVIAALPDIWREAEPVLREYLPGLIGAETSDTAFRIIGLLVALLRLRTTQSLWDKGAKP